MQSESVGYRTVNVHICSLTGDEIYCRLRTEDIPLDLSSAVKFHLVLSTTVIRDDLITLEEYGFPSDVRLTLVLTPPGGDLLEPVLCLVCNLWLNGLDQYVDHLQGKKHQKGVIKMRLQALGRANMDDPDFTSPFSDEILERALKRSWKRKPTWGAASSQRD